MLVEYEQQHRHIRDLLFQAVEAAVREDYEKLQDILNYLGLLVPAARANHSAVIDRRNELDRESRCLSFNPFPNDNDS